MTTVVQPSGETRDPVLLSKIRFVYQEGSKAGIVFSPVVCGVFAEQLWSLEELGEKVQKVIEVVRSRNQPFTPEVIGQVLRERPKPKPTQVAPLEVLQKVAEHFRVTIRELQGPNRHAYLALARQAAMLLLRDLSGLSSTEVGGYVGREHSTVLSGQKTAEERRDGDVRFWQDLADIKARLLRA